MQRRVFAILSGLAVFLTATVTMGSLAGGTPATRSHEPSVVRLLGRETFEPNSLVTSTFRFSPERKFPHTGERVRWLDQDQTADPHTITVVRRSQLPSSFPEAFNCRPCNEALDAHFGSGGPPVTRVDVGAPGFNQPGDSLLLLDGGSIGATITASAGSHLFYLCAIHPWMQGRLTVG
jgi:plastocyanin